jgi:phage shock protein A
MKNKIERLKVKETKLVSRGNKAVDEGREKKADRLLGRAAKVENRIIEKTGKKYASKSAKMKK